MARSLRSQKRQTRLAFQPLPSSSPAKVDYNSAIQDRLANVRYEGSRRSKTTTKDSDVDEHATPITPKHSPHKKTHLRASYSPSTAEAHTSPSLPLRTLTELQTQVNSDDDDEIPIPSSKRRKLSERLQESNIQSSVSSRRSTRCTNHSSPLSRGSVPYREPSDHDTPTRGSTPAAKETTTQEVDSASSASSLRASTDIPPSARRVESSLGSAETSGEDDVAIVTKPKARPRGFRKIQEDPFVVDDDNIEYISSEDEVAPKRSQRKAAIYRHDVDDVVVENNEVEYISSEENEDTIMSSSRHRSSKKSLKNSQKISRKEQEELAEDLLDLQDSDQEDVGRRTRGGPVTTQRDKTREHFARLKRQRAGGRFPRVIESDDEVEEYQDDDGFDGVDIDNIVREPNHMGTVSDDSSQYSLIGAPDPAPDEAVEAAVEGEEDDFIVEDESQNTGRHGRPNPDIPLQFTSFASAKPRELFINVVEWMVKNKISPAFSRDDDIFRLSFSRIDDQVKAQAGSRLISSAWGAVFKYAILARPSMRVNALPGLDEDNIRTCDACNRTNHPARYDFTFEGHPYHKDSLEPLDDDDEEEEEANDNEESDRLSYDQQGHALAPQHQHFYLGRFCAANAEMGHKLSHWKYHLNENVLSHLEEQGVLSASSILAREKLNKKKREKEAEAIVDAMDETGVIGELWQGFQDDLEDARLGMEDHYSGRGKGRGKNRVGAVRVDRGNGRIGEWSESGKYKEVLVVGGSDSEGE